MAQQGTVAYVVSLPKCDFDNDHGDAAVDGKTKMGPWANMCRDCFLDLGVGIGLGQGQWLEVAPATP